jgi:hypothetical protein
MARSAAQQSCVALPFIASVPSSVQCSAVVKGAATFATEHASSATPRSPFFSEGTEAMETSGRVAADRVTGAPGGGGYRSSDARKARAIASGLSLTAGEDGGDDGGDDGCAGDGITGDGFSDGAAGAAVVGDASVVGVGCAAAIGGGCAAAMGGGCAATVVDGGGAVCAPSSRANSSSIFAASAGLRRTTVGGDGSTGDGGC